MPESENQTTLVQGWIDCLRAGDPSARDALLACAIDRLERLTRKMLKDFPGVHRWEQTDDVLQNAILRLSRALQAVIPPSSRDFFRLAAVQIRRELIDLARHHSGPQGLGANIASNAGVDESARLNPADPADETHDPGRLADWTEFHRQVEALPDEEREVVDLLFYQGLQQAEAAAVLGVSERTVKRRWQSARLALHAALGGRLPGV
ncbi:MAG: sigma-70 family RNA polymerase sigma factor [Planctomycetaceae bacterium]|nr:sigma-70 family RNA polymerase sigma factor [Planctomycetaceae bacterium]MBV8265246.1 sigma-70 family RNA polymerase sigma factor [Planctomycetaceae bacterium]MBV8316649.1 sigma-70 family RNA polymerase sigma factor [Planctomycetaceae bacterium]MBV8609339.1 sigma-70 family RNA polymerase sigma factor [Singulisphaera sp.]